MTEAGDAAVASGLAPARSTEPGGSARAQGASRAPNVMPRLPDHPTDEELAAFFRSDTFASQQAGCRIIEGWRGHGVAEMEIRPFHLNAEGYVMGGAVFTLADYAFAAAAMCGQAAAVSLASTIEFMKATQGSKLTATCDIDRSGRRVGFYTIEVTDDEGERIAKVVTTCYHPITV